MTKFFYIKKIAKFLIQLLKDIINPILHKTGIKFHYYETFSDLESRTAISNQIKFILDNKKDKKILDILIIGSPGMQELKSIPNNYLKKLNITGVDLSEPQSVHRSSRKLKVNQYNFKKKNVFEYLSDEKVKYDLIINRYFLHHISKNNKKEITNLCFKKLLKGGYLLCVDWFIKDYKNEKELFNAIFDRYTYASKYQPILKNKMKVKNRDKSITWWNNMHKDNDFSGGKHPSRGEMVENLENAGFKLNQVINIGDEKIIDDTYLWGHVMIKSKR